MTLSFLIDSFTGVILILFLNQISCSFSNVIGEALIVISAQKSSGEVQTEEQKQAQASNSVSIFFGSKNLGVLLTAYTGGILLEYVSKQTGKHSQYL